ncbi:MAG: hypothetical protein NZ922_05975 [Candidatus Methanomethyliaceae archaeon]|nr:hypothetical protein [Candidatus Methanomethyliaceae archaeon]MDW7971093.1 hypothetical protein [Nitrososphaerota archaeon]
MTKISHLRRRESFTKLEIEMAIFDACERMASYIFSRIFPKNSYEGIIDLWELEITVDSILADVIEKISLIDPATAEVLSYEIREKPHLIDRAIPSMLECIKDAFGSLIMISNINQRTIQVKLSPLIRNRSFIRKDLRTILYEIIISAINK